MKFWNIAAILAVVIMIAMPANAQQKTKERVVKQKGDCYQKVREHPGYDRAKDAVRRGAIERCRRGEPF